MGKRKHRDLDADEQHVLERCHLKLLTSQDDIAQCDRLIVQHHYLLDVTRLLHGVSDQIVERVFLRWQQQVLGPVQDRVVLLDGKKIRAACAHRGPHGSWERSGGWR